LTSLGLSLLVLLAAYAPIFAQITRARVPSAFDPTRAAVRVGVLGLFHPREFIVSATGASALVLHAGEEQIVLENSSGVDSASVRISESDMVVTAGIRTVRASKIIVDSRKNDPVDFVLSVPGKITRHYQGILEIKPSAGNLIAIVTMDRETAIASVVAAESAPDIPLEALKAQAVATRSYFVASRGRHRDFDFCDTTHCQFLREPPSPESPAAKAVAATRDLVLAYDSRPVAAMYTRSCSGHTHTPAELGLPSGRYPYFPVECKYCRTHPVRWSSRLFSGDAVGLHSHNESARLDVDRRLGWAAVPSNDFTTRKENDEFILQGAGQGHGMGLCQSGAKAMAEEGADFRQILNRYYPNTTIVSWPAASAS
jgi:stage II sporulation protein D